MPLDFDMWSKLLFADNMLYDYGEDVVRPVRPDDRLMRHTARPFQDWSAPAELKCLVLAFADAVAEFFLLGGTNFDPVDEEDDERRITESPELMAARMTCLKHFAKILDL